MSRFLEALRSGRVLLMDGAMGTELQRAGLPDGGGGEEWNISHPQRVRAVHRAYVEAGAEVLLTNTFQANPVTRVDRYWHFSLDRVAGSAIEIALSSLRQGGFLLGDVGAFQSGPGARDRLQHLHDCRALHAAFQGVDAILAETWTHRASLRSLVLAGAGEGGNSPGLPVLVSVTYQLDGLRRPVTRLGESPQRWARFAEKVGAAALGVNCGRDIGMGDVIEIVRRYRDHTDLPVFARPNAGTPVRVGDHWVYPQTPEMMAERLPELLEAGVSMVGGCCGTTPAHIAAFRRAVDDWNAR